MQFAIDGRAVAIPVAAGRARLVLLEPKSARILAFSPGPAIE